MEQWYHEGKYTDTGSSTYWNDGNWNSGNWLFDKETKTWTEKKQKHRWAWADQVWDVQGKCWYLKEIIGLTLSDELIAGDGKMENPYRLKSKDIEHADRQERASKIIPVTREGDTSVDIDPKPEKKGMARCPKCDKMDGYYDDYMDDNYCFSCGEYHNQLRYLLHSGKTTKTKKELVSHRQALNDMKAELQSSRIIRMTSEMLLNNPPPEQTGTDRIK